MGHHVKVDNVPHLQPQRIVCQVDMLIAVVGSSYVKTGDEKWWKVLV